MQLPGFTLTLTLYFSYTWQLQFQAAPTIRYRDIGQPIIKGYKRTQQSTIKEAVRWHVINSRAIFKEEESLFCLSRVSTTEQSTILIVEHELQSIILTELEGTRCTGQKKNKSLQLKTQIYLETHLEGWETRGT